MAKDKIFDLITVEVEYAIYSFAQCLQVHMQGFLLQFRTNIFIISLRGVILWVKALLVFSPSLDQSLLFSFSCLSLDWADRSDFRHPVQEPRGAQECVREMGLADVVPIFSTVNNWKPFEKCKTQFQYAVSDLSWSFFLYVMD